MASPGSVASSMAVLRFSLFIRSIGFALSKIDPPLPVPVPLLPEGP